MEKMFSILFIIALTLSLCSCEDNILTASENETSVINIGEPIKTNMSKDDVDKFIELFGGPRKIEGLVSDFAFDEEHCYNVTPPEVEKETDMRIFKFSDFAFSYIVIDNEYYEICPSMGGYGFVNAVPCDFDNDGNKDLLIASSWGSGLHRSNISVFNSVMKESTIVYDTSGTDNPQVDLIVAPSNSSYLSDVNNVLPVSYQVYSVDIVSNDIENAYLVDLSYVPTELVGSIEVENDIPTFKPYEE